MKTAFPYPILAGDVKLAADAVWVDNIPLSLKLISDEERVIALHEIKRDWDEIRVKVSVSVDADELTAGVWTSPECMATVRNRKTNVRLTFPLHYDGGGIWSGEVELRRGEHVGRCEIDAWIVAEVKGVEGRLIGRAENRWSADFEAKQPTRQRSIKMVWKDFANHSFLNEFRDDPWMLDAEAGEPVLYLNSSLEGFRAVLGNPSGADQKLVREVMATQIASEAWTAMFNTALYACAVERGEPQWPGGWQEYVLRRMLPDFFPEISPDEALVELVGRRVSGESGSDLHARLMHSATLNSKKQKTVANTVRTLARMADVKDNS
ncbi:hypothetical protein HRW18_05835 [Streptomyces lunaelactis]|uniref:hypothetical protein n=1 Tax=Streptomyces lunaelactis TaxID=1535768 RepID=UPI0015849B36|nr:hypothetical protein [Streptomyces lunaelactis]NUK07542.1 hypothetical protein [Streptomyces lunaelactis]NUK56811.1 hypothetical protein [Streptomyces lunaelactis]NUL12909.1 hypothetical protein [Streptomyces lunaelactis]NUL21414.1 hypothetical protein [Streptomyces lunaelactis]